MLCVALLFSGAAQAADSGSNPSSSKSASGLEAAQAISTITGVAISPLLGVSGIGVWKYFKTAPEKRAKLPWYAQPWFWGPALLLVVLAFVKDTFGTALPTVVKKPLDVAEAIENKISGLVAAGAFVPLIAAIFAATGDDRALYGDAGLAMMNLTPLLNLLTVPLAIAAFVVVWMVSRVVHVLILISPFTTVDAALKSVRPFVLSTVAGTAFVNPYVGAAWSLVIILICFLLAGWSFRLMIFGTVFTWDLVTFRKNRFKVEPDSNWMFTACEVNKTPIRTYGKLSRGRKTGGGKEEGRVRGVRDRGLRQLRALIPPIPCAGWCDGRQLRALHPRFPHGSARQRTGRALAPVRQRRRAICPAPRPAPASQTREAPDLRAAFLPAIRALSRGHRARFGRCRSIRGQLVDDVHPSSDSGGVGAPVVGLHQSAYRGRASRLRDRALARTPGVAFERSGLSRARGHRLGSRACKRTRERGSPDRAPPGHGCRRRDRCVSAARTTAQHESPRLLTGQSSHPRLSGQSAIGSLVRHSLTRAGIKAPTTGAHQFRHALATQMLRHGASLTEIGEVLRHRSPETTKIYTKVDLDALRTLALPWPGGLR